MKNLILGKNILENNDEIAGKIRDEMKDIFTINLLGSPGAGKTSVLEELIDNIKDKYNMAVIEGDLYTSKDGERIEKHNVKVVQVNTGGGCHLEASMVERALKDIDKEGLDFLVIENVGNLVCPASYDLGEDMKVVVMSVTEGNDKPLKYPSMFQRSSVVILNKIDMIHLTDFNKEEFYRDVNSLNKDIKVVEISCREDKGLGELTGYFTSKIEEKRAK
ncbi:MAG: hydrogenase nickel incorporation protein HypB [Clostridium sp.]|uniref:hydrogenase nickel incorporation protein HypB n=1 Tax=Clostridium sp. TaxID=1506 RepID=UPI00305C68A2